MELKCETYLKTYKVIIMLQTDLTKEFSKFEAGYRNRKGIAVLQTKPSGVTDILSVYNYITSDAPKPVTLQLRSMIGKKSDSEISEFKKLNFKIVCVRGVFLKRCAEGLATPSYYLPIDIDDLASAEEAREVQQIIINDPHLEVALSFTSPSGFGAKIFIEIPEWAADLGYRQQYDFIAAHIGIAHGILLDRSGSDVARAAFLGWDPQAYINPKYLINNSKF